MLRVPTTVSGAAQSRRPEPGTAEVSVLDNRVTGQANFEGGVSAINGITGPDGTFLGQIGIERFTGTFAADHFEGTFSSSPCTWTVSLLRGR